MFEEDTVLTVKMINDRDSMLRQITESYLDPMLIDIDYSSTDVLVVFTNGPAVEFKLSGDGYYLDFEAFGSYADFFGPTSGISTATSVGLLGNVNSVAADDIRSFDGAVFSPPVGEDVIYQMFTVTCKFRHTCMQTYMYDSYYFIILLFLMDYLQGELTHLSC